MENDLFKPSLTEEHEAPELSYKIDNFYYVAFFGGAVSALLLAAINAKHLALKKNRIWLIVLAGITVLGIKGLLIYLSVSKVIALNTRSIKLIYRALSLLLALGYIKLMRKEYNWSLHFHGQTKSIWLDFFKSLIVAIPVEFAMVYLILS